MTPEQFAYWLQGFAELHPEPPTPEQWQAIRDHLATVFVKVTPPTFSEQVLGPRAPALDGTGKPFWLVDLQAGPQYLQFPEQLVC